MFVIDLILLVGGLLLLLGIVSSKLGTRLGMPVLVLFLLVGMLAGSEGIGGLEFEDYRLAHAIGTVALVMILFDGGLGTSLAAIHVAWKPSVLLATVGVLVAAKRSPQASTMSPVNPDPNSLNTERSPEGEDFRIFPGATGSAPKLTKTFPC